MSLLKDLTATILDAFKAAFTSNPKISPSAKKDAEEIYEGLSDSIAKAIDDYVSAYIDENVEAGTNSSTTPENQTINSLKDVLITSPSLNEILKYDGKKWVNSVSTSSSASGAGVTDGVFGDVTVSSNGTVWSIDIDALMDDLGSTRGSIIYRGASGWTVLAPNTAGYVLTDGGVGADPSWGAAGGISDGDKGDITVTGSGTTWTIDTGVVTLAKMANIATQRLIGRNTAATGVPEALAISTVIDWLGSTRGSIAYRGASGWTILAPNTAGYVLTDGGVGADPSWVAAGGVSDGDKGDITVSASGATWTIDSAAVTLAKMANLAESRIIGRAAAAGTGVPQALTSTEVSTILGLGTAAFQATSAFEASGSIATHALITSGVHGISAFGATLVDDANAAAARTTLGLVIGTDVEAFIASGTTSQYWRGDKTWQTLNNTAVGLGSVENIALTTWTGSVNITTVGTVTTGTWSATTIAVARGGTGMTSLGTQYQVIRVNSGSNALEYANVSTAGTDAETLLWLGF